MQTQEGGGRGESVASCVYNTKTFRPDGHGQFRCRTLLSGHSSAMEAAAGQIDYNLRSQRYLLSGGDITLMITILFYVLVSDPSLHC